MKTKKCTKCGKRKKWLAFPDNPTVKCGKDCWCKICRSEYGKVHYQKNLEENRTTRREYSRLHSEEHKSTANAWYKENRKRIRKEAYNKYWSDPEKARFQSRNIRHKRIYGITIEQKNEIGETRGCGICGTKDTGIYATGPKQGQKREWHSDHEHETGKFRDILCDSCNYLIGNCKENPEILVKAIDYLKKHGGKDVKASNS